jgi:hypothetical protein
MIQETTCITNQPAKFTAPENDISLIKSNALPFLNFLASFLKLH